MESSPLTAETVAGKHSQRRVTGPQHFSSILWAWLGFLAPSPTQRLGGGGDLSGLIQPRNRKTFWLQSSLPPPTYPYLQLSTQGCLQISLPSALLLPDSFPGRSAVYLSPLLSCCQSLRDPGCPLPKMRRLISNLSTPNSLHVQGLQHTVKPRDEGALV